MEFYPARSLDQRRIQIRVAGGPKVEAEIMNILRHLHYGAGSRLSFLIMQGILRNGVRAEGLTITFAPPSGNALTLVENIPVLKILRPLVGSNFISQRRRPLGPTT